MCSLCPASGGRKRQFWANFDFWGAPVPTPFTYDGQIWCAIANPQRTFTCFYRPLAAKNPNFCRFLDSWQQSEKVEHGCTTTNYPLSNGIKIISVFQRLHGEIGRTNSDVQNVTDTKSVTESLDRPKTLTFFAAPAAGETRSPPNLAWCTFLHL